MSVSTPSDAAPTARAAGRVSRALQFAVIVPLARLRFLFVLGAIGFIIVNWDDLLARYEKYARPAAAAHAADPGHEYFCPMHPTVVRDTNKEKCPICFMPLSKRKTGEPSDVALPAGTVARVQLTPYHIALAGVRTAPVEYHALSREITTVGTVEFDERKLKTVSARVKGRIDTLRINQTGQMVHAGDPLAELYSPDLVVTVQNLLDGRSTNNKLQEELARDRLKLWGIDDAQVEEIAKAGKPITHLTIRSPIRGHVLKKYIREGQYVGEGGPLFDVADLSTVWLQAQLYEDDLAFLPAGGHDPQSGKPDYDLTITAATRAFPGRPFTGTLSFLFPHVDVETRTLTLRFDVPNKDHELRPGMTATVTLALPHDLLAKTPAGARIQARGGKILAVPETSVIDTGTRQVVYKQSLPDTFDGVAVELGPKLSAANGAVFYPLLSGLAVGDRVVAAGSFLIDAETRLNPALGSTFIGGSGGHARGSVMRPTTPDEPDAKVAAAFAQLLPEERKQAEAQEWCPVLGGRLGLMGKPIKVDIGGGSSVFVCCDGCTASAKADPAKVLQRLEELKTKGSPSPPAPKLSSEEVSEIRAELEKLPPDDRAAAEKQRLCPVSRAWIGSMPDPKKVTIGGRTVFLCCKSCEKEAVANPAPILKKVDELKQLPPLSAGGRP